MGTYQQLADKVKRLTVFCIEHRGHRCFAGWGADKLFRYVAFQLLNGCLFVEFDQEGKVAALAFLWPAKADDLKRRAEANQPQFEWMLPNFNGDAIFIAEVIGKRQYMPWIVRQVNGAWPDSPRKQLFTYRKNGLTEIRWPVLRRFTCELT